MKTPKVLTKAALMVLLIFLGCRPVAVIQSPSDGASFDREEEISFICTAVDVPDGLLPGAAIVWTSDVDGEIGTGSPLLKSGLTEGPHTVTVTVTDSADRRAYDRVTIRIGNQAPQAVISSPADGSTFDRGESILFKGRGIDAEDGPLDNRSLTWQSSLDGGIGTGWSFVRSDLTAGPHAITLTARDSGGAQAITAIKITVDSSGALTTTSAGSSSSSSSTTTSSDTTSSSSTTTTISGWAGMELPGEEDLRGVWGSSATNIYAAGSDRAGGSGVILHYDGTDWTESYSDNASGMLYDVWGSSAANIFAAGGYDNLTAGRGSLFLYDGSTWSEVCAGDAEGILSGVWGSSDEDVYAVGYDRQPALLVDSTVLHYDGSGCDEVNTGAAEGYLYGVWGISGNYVYAVGGKSEGSDFTGQVVQLVGEGDSRFVRREVRGAALRGIWSSGSTVFAVGGSDATLDSGVVQRSTDAGEDWSKMSISAGDYRLNDVWGSSSADVYAVGDNGTHGAIYHFNGTTWSELVRGVRPLHGIWGFSSSGIFIVGDNVILKKD